MKIVRLIILLAMALMLPGCSFKTHHQANELDIIEASWMGYISGWDSGGRCENKRNETGKGIDCLKEYYKGLYHLNDEIGDGKNLLTMERLFGDPPPWDTLVNRVPVK